MYLKSTLEVLPMDQLLEELKRADRQSERYCCETQQRWLAYHTKILSVIKARNDHESIQREPKSTR